MRAFLVPPGLSSRTLAPRLVPVGRLKAGAPHTTRRVFYDTFDWGLHRAGLLLEEVSWGGSPRLSLRPIAGGPPQLSQPGPAPRFARELPPGPLRERLLPLTEPRALLPLLVTEVVAEPLALHDPAGRTLARLSLESALVGPPGQDPAVAVPPGLVVQGGRRAEAVVALLSSLPDLAAAPEDALALLLAPLGRVPRDYTGKVAVDFDPSLAARDATHAILRKLFATMERNLPGLREDLDPEFLHDFRVAVRRTRSALGQIRGVLPPASVARFGREFRRLQEVTGPARDLDVYALELPALCRLLPGGSRRSLGPLARLVERRRTEAHRALVKELDLPWFARLLAAWREYLARPAPRRPRRAPNALRPVREIAAERIGKLFRRALREGKAIGPASPPGDLHELRKTCKKLRYLLEFFHSLLDRGEAAQFIAALKGLQDNLGRHQDLQVQAGELLGFARELAREGKARPPAFLAMGMLVERLREEQAAERRAFAERFAEFARARNRKRMKWLLAHVPVSPSMGEDQGAAVPEEGHTLPPPPPIKGGV